MRVPIRIAIHSACGTPSANKRDHQTPSTGTLIRRATDGGRHCKFEAGVFQAKTYISARRRFVAIASRIGLFLAEHATELASQPATILGYQSASGSCLGDYSRYLLLGNVRRLAFVTTGSSVPIPSRASNVAIVEEFPIATPKLNSVRKTCFRAMFRHSVCR